MFSETGFEQRCRFSLRALAGVMLCLLLLSGCVTKSPELIEALKRSHVSQVRVEAAPDVRTGLPMINGVTPQQQVDMIVTAVQRVAMRDLKGYPGGPTPARLVITLQQADLASTTGRVLLESDSWIMGTVRLEHASTGQLIAQNPRIRGENRAVKGGGAAKIVTIAINAAMTQSQEALAEKLAVSFVYETKQWLTPSEDRRLLRTYQLKEF